MGTQTYTYASGTGFTYDPAKIGFADGAAELIVSAFPGQSFVPAISSASFDATELVYSSGALRQLDKRPATATFYAAWTSALNANWSGMGNGSLVVTPFGGAAINAGALDLTGSSGKYITFDATNNADSLQTVSIEFQVTPNYSGAPSDDQFFLNISSAQNSSHNLIDIDHFTDGRVYVDLYPSTGGDFALELSHGFNPTAGTTYTFLIQFNASTGIGTMFVDGTQVDQETADPWVRTGPVAYGVIGNSYDNAGTTANFSIKNFAFYSTVVTPASAALSPTIYIAGSAVLPEFTYAGLGSVQAFTDSIAVDTGVPAYTFNGHYWNGSAWVASNGTYAQANPMTTAEAHIASLTPANTLQIDAIFQAGNTIGTITSVGVVYTGEHYASAPISPSVALSVDSVSDFVVASTSPSSTAVNFYFGIGASNYYWSGTAWVVSDGSFAQSNDVATVVANLATLPVSDGAFLVVYALLYTPDGLATPTLTTVEVTYDTFTPPPPSPNVCGVYGYIVDESNTPVENAIVTITNPKTFVNRGSIVAQGKTSVTSDSAGYFHISLVETETLDNVTMNFAVVYPFATSQNIGTPANAFSFGNAVIPDQPDANLADLTFI